MTHQNERSRPAGNRTASKTLAGSGSMMSMPLQAPRGLISTDDLPWFLEAAVALRDLVNAGGCFTVDAVRETVNPPAGQGAFGALMTAAARAGWVTSIGLVASAWPSRNGGAVTLWRAVRVAGGDR